MFLPVSSHHVSFLSLFLAVCFLACIWSFLLRFLSCVHLVVFTAFPFFAVACYVVALVLYLEKREKPKKSLKSQLLRISKLAGDFDSVYGKEKCLRAEENGMYYRSKM